MRARRALLTAAVAALLAACADQPAEPEVAVAGELGTVPLVTFPTPYPLGEESVDVALQGDGDQLEAGDVALLLVSGYDGDDAQALGQTARPRVVRLEESSTDLYDALVGVTVGSRVVVARPVASETGEYMEIVVIDVMPLSAVTSDTTQEELPDSVPQVGQDASGAPTIDMADAVEPEALQILPLVSGTGAQVLPDDTVYGQYTVWTWDDAAVYDSTWEDGGTPVAVDLPGAWEGLENGLVDQTVGSRVLLLIPPELGIGSDSLIVVFDILAREADS